MVSVTSARPSAGRPDVPAKTTSSILPPRSGLTPCSPITQEKASTTLDLPDPFGPTTQVMPGSKRSVVAEAKDLKPRRVRVLTNTRRLLPHHVVLQGFSAPYRGWLAEQRIAPPRGFPSGQDVFVTPMRISRRAALAAGAGLAGAAGLAAGGYGLVQAGELPGKYRLAQLT